MEPFTLIHQGVLFLHLTAFALAFSAVVREDIALLRAKRIDFGRLAVTARWLSAALVALWVTGLGLLAFDVGLDASRLLASPKPLAKVLVVSALSANGLALHVIAFPALREAGTAGRAGRTALAVMLGAISTASWLCASFIGVSRLIAESMRLRDFIALYSALLIGAITTALVFVRPRLARALSTRS